LAFNQYTHSRQHKPTAFPSHYYIISTTTTAYLTSITSFGFCYSTISSRSIATMAALTHAQGVFDEPEGMSTFSYVHTCDPTVPPSLATGPTDSQQIPTPDDFTHLAQQPHSGKHICHSSTMWVRSDTVSLRNACARIIPSKTQRMTQSPASRLETCLDSLGKTPMPTYPKTVNPHFVSLPTAVKSHVTISEATDAAARPLPAQTPGCETATNARSKAVTTIAAPSTGQTTTHGNISADTLSGGFGSPNVSTASPEAAMALKTAISSPEDARDDPGENQDDPRAKSQSGIVHMTARTCK
jgi:hypothetical protein